MKKLLILVIALAIISGAAFASDNQSAAYVRMLSRETATDSIDIAYFNPAGTAFLPEGFHVQLNNQTVYLNYAHTSMTFSTEYTSQVWIPFFPTAFIGYNGGKWATFASFTIPEGGGTVNYPDGAVIFDGFGGGTIEASSAYYSISLGGSYRFGDTLGIAAMGSLVLGDESIDLDVGGAGSTKSSGTGYSVAFGAHYNPIDPLKFSVTVETGQRIDMEYTEVTGTAGALFTQGDIVNADSPWRIRAGASYTFGFGLEIPVSFKYDFYKAMDSNLRNSWSASMAGRYWITDTFELSIGASYDIDEYESLSDWGMMQMLDPPLSSVTIAGGVGWEIIDNLKLDIGALYPFYFAEAGGAIVGATDFEKQVINMAIGIGYVF